MLRILCVLVLWNFASGNIFDVFRSRVCYGSLGCFTNDAPFSNALDELPESPKDVGVTLTLYTPDDPSKGQDLDYRNPKSVQGSGFDPKDDIKFIIHGYQNNGSEDWILNLKSEFLKLGSFNVIRVAWGPGAHKFYPQSVANTRLVGAIAAQLLTSLRDVYNVSMSQVHLLGHSLGAHIAGYIGSRVPGIGRISGMDPAGPLFESTDEQVRIDSNDATFVDCIHTDGLPLVDLGFGTMAAWCDADFYPNGGGQQPGCPAPVSSGLADILTFRFDDAEVVVSCSHGRAIDYYTESIATCRFPATPCDTYDDFKAGKCTCGPEGCSAMGYHADPKQKGKFFLTTKSAQPFC